MTKRRKTRTAPKAQSPAAFNTAHKRWLKTQAEWRAVAWGSTSIRRDAAHLARARA